MEKHVLELAERIARTGVSFRGETKTMAEELIRLHREIEELRVELGIEED
jgi:Mn-dependent DtxR family transcriptional regulator